MSFDQLWATHVERVKDELHQQFEDMVTTDEKWCYVYQHCTQSPRVPVLLSVNPSLSKEDVFILTKTKGGEGFKTFFVCHTDELPWPEALDRLFYAYMCEHFKEEV